MTAAESELFKGLLEQNRLLTEQIVELAKEALRSNVQPSFVPVDMELARFPLNVAESEEDARAMHKAGAIDDQELEDMLNEIGFYNAEMVVPTA